jgi:hypothetical protein
MGSPTHAGLDTYHILISGWTRSHARKIIGLYDAVRLGVEHVHELEAELDVVRVCIGVEVDPCRRSPEVIVARGTVIVRNSHVVSPITFEVLGNPCTALDNPAVVIHISIDAVIGSAIVKALVDLACLASSSARRRSRAWRSSCPKAAVELMPTRRIARMHREMGTKTEFIAGMGLAGAG